MFQITKRCVNPVKEDVVLGVSRIISVVVTVVAEDGIFAVKISRWYAQMSTDNLNPVRADVVTKLPSMISVIVTVNVEE